MLDLSRFRSLLTEYYPLFSILIGVALISVVLGPFQNTDTQLEFSAASGVLRWGMPFMKYAGDMINQPPLGFYTEALVFKIFGLSFNNGVALITAFGLGCTFLVYKIGKNLYGKPTGLFAAALFALTPWQLALSRSFLIDVQCLFFSLLALFVGIYSIRKNSFKLLLVSGTFFAFAFLTKFYAIYALIPLGLFYAYSRPKNLRRIFTWVGAYFVPLAIFFFIWYQVVSGQGLLGAFANTDFHYFNSGFVPSYFFVGNFLLSGLSWWFLAAITLSLLISLTFRKLFSKIIFLDLICLATIIIVGVVNTVLGAGLNLSSPYLNPIKYDYQALPFFSLLAASLASKCFSVLNSAKSREKLAKRIFSLIAWLGLGLLGVSIFLNLGYVHQFVASDYIVFRVELNRVVGYSFFNYEAIGRYSPLMSVMYVGFAFVLSGLLWAGRDKLGRLRKRT